MRILLSRLAPLVLLLLLFSGSSVAEETTDLPDETTSTEAIVKGSIVVKGEGVAPATRPLSSAQKRIMALRAAKVVAIREAAEILNGMAVTGDTIILNASTRSDAVRTTVEGLVKGATVIKEVYDPLAEMAAVYVNVPLTGPDGVYAKLLPQVLPVLPFDDLRGYVPPTAPPEASNDGLIVDATGVDFKPALLNRVLAENGEVVYDPTKVAQSILVERGAAEYTNDVGKARALLSERGSVNPVVVKAAGAVKGTDVVVSPADAGAIFASNQRKNYLEGAKVVFVLR